MKFIPRDCTEKQIQESALIPNGDYDFEIVKATEKKSKAGNIMMELKLKVWDSNGKERFMFDFLLTDTDMMMFKFKHFCESVGLQSQFELGEVTEGDCLNKSGRVRIFIQQDKSGQYGPRNSVKDYLSVTGSVSSKSDISGKNDPFQDSDIPF
jgi:hypothetical protein